MSETPEAVTGVSAEGRIGAIDLSWERPAWEPLVDHVAVHASDSSSVGISAETLVGTTVYGFFRDDTLGTAAVERHYRLVTVGASGERSDPSSVVSATSTESAAHQGRVLAQVGEFDSQSTELALAADPPAVVDDYADAFPDGVDFVYGESDPDTDWCYLHPGPDDSWGTESDSTFRLRFELESVPDNEVQVAIWLVDTHSIDPGELEIVINSESVAKVELGPGGTQLPMESDATVIDSPLVPSFVEEVLPTRHLRAGENTLEIIKVTGAWHAYDAVGVFERDE